MKLKIPWQWTETFGLRWEVRDLPYRFFVTELGSVWFFWKRMS